MIPPRRDDFITTLELEWETDPRWVGITHPYSAADVYRLSGSVAIEYSLARFGAARLRELLGTEPYLAVLHTRDGRIDRAGAVPGRTLGTLRNTPGPAARRPWRSM